MTPLARLLPPVVPTLLVGSTGALLFQAIGFPAAFVTGSATAVAIASLLGVRTSIPVRLCDVVFILIGVQIGSTVTPDVIDAALRWPISLLILTLTLVVILVVVPRGLRIIFGHRPVTAFLSATPGHLTFVLGLSADLKADVPQVVLIQTVRVFLLTLLVPVLISLWGVTGTGTSTHQGVSSPLELAAILGVALGTGLIFKHFAVPAPLLIGAMLASAIGHGSGFVAGVAPAWVTLGAFVCMGSLIGTRFDGTDKSLLRKAFLAGVFSTLAGCVIAAAGAFVAAKIIDLPAAALFLAFAPGGVEVMAALAIETGLEPALVAAHHVFRLVILGVLLPVFAMHFRNK